MSSKARHAWRPDPVIVTRYVLLCVGFYLVGYWLGWEDRNATRLDDLVVGFR